MASMSIQLHATPDELRSFMKGAAKELDLIIIELTGNPFSLRSLGDIDFTYQDELHQKFRWFQYYLFKEQPNLDVTQQFDFFKKNPTHLALSIGKHTTEGLIQSSISMKTDDPETVRIGKMIAAKLKRITKVGATAWSPGGHDKAFYRTFRYTDKAKALEEKGVKILPFAGECTMRLGKV